MEDLLATDLPSGKPTNFGAAFKRSVQFLRNRKIPHIFIGTLALNTFIRPRMTDEIQIICDHFAIEQLVDELRSIAEQAAFSGNVRLWHSEPPAMAYALTSRAPKVLFDVRANIPSALALCWLFLESEDLRSQGDAGSLLAAGTVSSDELQSLLEQHARDAALNRLSAVNRSIQRGGYSGTYNDSVRARLLRRQQKSTPN